MNGAYRQVACMLGILSCLTATKTGAAEKPVSVLSYSSMTGKGSLGELLISEFSKSCAGCEVKIQGTADNAGLLGRLRSFKKRKLSAYDVVLGLADGEYRQALAEGLIEEGVAFDESPFSIIVDTTQIAAADLPKSWAELGVKLKSQLLAQDPRTSSVGVGWLYAIEAHKLIDTSVARAVVKRYYPSWSASYEAFTNKESAAVWSFLSSEAYHRCHAKTDAERTRYVALPLVEGYPVQREWIARVKGLQSERVVRATKFEALVLSEPVQSEIPRRNWMFPIDKSVKLEPCFTSVTAVKRLPAFDKPELLKWLDKWSLAN